MTAPGTAWSTVVALVGPEEVDAASGLLWDAGVAGVEERPGASDDRVELRAGVPADDLDAVLDALHGRVEVRVEPVVGDDDLDRWREWARPWRAGSRVVVVPAWQPAPEWVGPDDLVLSIDPGRAFGSGAHPTTRMCLAELERLVEPEAAVADVGCGSGVLAVAAAAQGAALVAAVDVDPEAVRATAENADRNGVAARVASSGTDVVDLEAEAFDVVVANIGAATLVALAPELTRIVAPDGTVVVSGILDEQVPEVLAAFDADGFALAGTVAEDQWRTVLVRRP